MKLYKNGICVYNRPESYVDSIEYYVNDSLDGCPVEIVDPWDYIKDMMEGQGFSLKSVIDICPGILNATMDDEIILANGVPFFWPFDMQETDSKEAIDVWLSVLQQIDCDAIWKIELDEQ